MEIHDIVLSAGAPAWGQGHTSVGT